MNQRRQLSRLRERLTADVDLRGSLGELEAGVTGMVDELRGHPVKRPTLLYAALAAVLVSLLAMIVVPVVVQEQLDRIHEELDVAVLPASQQVEELRYFMAREMALARGYALSGDSGMLAELYVMRDSASRRVEFFPDEALALSPAVAEDVGAAAAYVEAWHAAFDPRSIQPRRAQATGAFARTEYQAALAGLDSLRASLARLAADRRTLIREAEREQIGATVGLGLLALVSAGLIAWLVTRVRRLAHIAEAQRLAAESANRARDRLIRGMSHDLKNPLAVIDGYSELLEMGLRGPLTEEQRATIERIRVTVRSLLATVVELVDLSSAQAGLLRVQREEIAPGPLLRELASDYAGVAESNDLELTLEPVAEELPRFFADRRRVRQILENLLGNAIKYTPAGGAVELSAARVEHAFGRTGDWIAFHVEDTGPGIPPDRTEAVFEEFVRLENAAGTAGSGVGLAMARGLARAMGGEITVVSEPGEGSVFTLWLPLGTSDRRGSARARPEPAARP